MVRARDFMVVWCGVLFLLASTSYAIVSWDGGGDGVTWEDEINWNNNLDTTSADWVLINGPVSEVTVSSSVTCSRVRVANLAAAQLTVKNGGTLNMVTATMHLALGATGSAVLNVNSGGTINASNVALIAYRGTGVVNHSGTSSFANIVMGDLSTGNGTFNMDAGVLNCNVLQPGRSGTGVVNMSAGVINAGIGVSLGLNATANGTLHLDGGTIYTPNLTFGAGTSAVDITDGTMVIDFKLVDEGELWADFKARLEGLGVTGYGSTSKVVYCYDDTEMVATLTAVPEPATMTLIGFGAMLFLRKRNK